MNSCWFVLPFLIVLAIIALLVFGVVWPFISISENWHCYGTYVLDFGWWHLILSWSAGSAVLVSFWDECCIDDVVFDIIMCFDLCDCVAWVPCLESFFHASFWLWDDQVCFVHSLSWWKLWDNQSQSVISIRHCLVLLVAAFWGSCIFVWGHIDSLRQGKSHDDMASSGFMCENFLVIVYKNFLSPKTMLIICFAACLGIWLTLSMGAATSHGQILTSIGGWNLASNTAWSFDSPILQNCPAIANHS